MSHDRHFGIYLGVAVEGRSVPTHRRSPELYESTDAVSDVPHASAIRAALTEMGVSTIVCVQGVPTVAILAADRQQAQHV